MQQLAALLNANCLKGVSGHVYAEGSFPATRFDLDRWMKNTAGAVDRQDGSHGFFYRVDLRSFAATCRQR